MSLGIDPNEKIPVWKIAALVVLILCVICVFVGGLSDVTQKPVANGSINITEFFCWLSIMCLILLKK